MGKDHTSGYKWILLALVSATYFLAQGSRQVFNAVLPQIKTDFAGAGITDTQLGLVGSAFTLVFGLAIPFGGVLADFFSRKWMIVALVTGAASGMGLMTAQEFARLGAKVVMCDLDESRLRQEVEELKRGGVGECNGVVVPCAGDVREFAHAEAAAKIAASLGGCDILVTCAGGNEARCCKSNVPFYEQPVEVIDWGLDVNLKGAVYFARAAMPQMVAKKSGVICCLGSVTGFEGDGVGTMYGTAKSGLFNFVKGLAIAGGPHNVRALCVTPGPVLTRAAMSGMPTALGRAGETHELVDVILFMCSGYASFITGSNHVVDGGRLCMYRPYVPPKETAK